MRTESENIWILVTISKLVWNGQEKTTRYLIDNKSFYQTHIIVIASSHGPIIHAPLNTIVFKNYRLKEEFMVVEAAVVDTVLLLLFIMMWERPWRLGRPFWQ